MSFWRLSFLTASMAAFLLAFGPPALAQANKKAGEKKAAEKEEKEEKQAKKKKKTGGEVSAPEEKSDLDVAGTLGAASKGSPDFHEFTYTAVDGKKKSAKKAWLKIDSETTSLADRVVALESFKEGDSLKIFAKPVERESGSRGGVGGGKNFRIMQAARVIFGGKDVTVNPAYSDAKDKEFEWCDCSVEKPGAGMTVIYNGSSYKLDLDRKSSIVLKREAADPKKDLKKGVRVLVKANVLQEQPAGEKEERPAYRAAKVIVADPRATAWFDAIYK